MGDFFRFYREYAQTGVHAASAAALTAFGLLMQFHKGFAVLALLAYVLPLTHQYRQAGDDDSSTRERREDESAGVDSHAPNAESTSFTESEAEAEPGVDSDSDSGDVAVDEGDDTRPSATWEPVDSAVDTDLLDVVDVTEASEGPAAYAVGEGGVVLGRERGEWDAILEDGPAAAANTLRGVDTTDDGRGVWFTGDGGALGRVDVETGRHTDHSAPNDNTSTWSDVAVTGDEGRETLLLVNGSGQVLRGQYDGEKTRWESPVKPGSGSSIAAVESVDSNGDRDETGVQFYVADTNGQVFQSTGGSEWESIGIEDAGTLTDVGVGASSELLVTDDDGKIHRYDDAVWTPVHRSESALCGVAVDDAVAVAVGDDGTVLERTDGSWEHNAPFGAGSLAAACLTADEALAVGEGGAVLERRR
jgi:hypothetical protein